jgi:hypothetical protein
MIFDAFVIIVNVLSSGTTMLRNKNIKLKYYQSFGGIAASVMVTST